MDESLTIAAKNLAVILDITIARVGQLAKEGVIEKQENGQYLASAITDYIKFIRNAKGGKDIEEERRRLIKEQADKLERENRIADGEVVLVEELNAALVGILAQIVPILESIPNNIKRSCPTISAREIEIVKKEIVKARNIAADCMVD